MHVNKIQTGNNNCHKIIIIKVRVPLGKKKTITIHQQVRPDV